MGKTLDLQFKSKRRNSVIAIFLLLVAMGCVFHLQFH
jgi:hypothetical protein